MTRMHHYNDFSSFDPNGWSPAAGVDYRVDLVDDSAHVVATFETSFRRLPLTGSRAGWGADDRAAAELLLVSTSAMTRPGRCGDDGDEESCG